MAFDGTSYALGIAVQSAVDVPATINAPADLLTCYDLRPAGESYTLANPEATGDKNRPGDAITGRSRSISFNIIMRGPGGSSPPAVDTFVLGRILRAAGFEETSQNAALVATGALASGTTTSCVLPVGASGVDDFYNGLPAILSSAGAGVKGVSMVRDYVGSTRTATFMETFGSALSGNVTIPAFLAYRYKFGAPELFLSVDYWLHRKRYKMVNAVISSLQFNFETSNNSNTAFCSISVTLTGDVHPSTPELDENTPAIAQGGAIPVLADADFHLAQTSVCGSGATVNFNIQTDRAPCPSKLSGGEAPQITEIRRSVDLNLNEVLLATKDWNTIAAAQGNESFWTQIGTAAGRTVSFGVTDGRLSYSEAEINGSFVTRPISMQIDAVEKSMALVYPYGF